MGKCKEINLVFLNRGQLNVALMTLFSLIGEQLKEYYSRTKFMMVYRLLVEDF